MRLRVWLYAILWGVFGVLATHAPAFAAVAPEPALAGVWISERSFGPRIAGGDLSVTIAGDRWTARISDETATYDGAGSDASFAFTDGSALRLHRAASVMTGQWIQPATVTTGSRFATPVQLSIGAEGGWRGAVHPLADVQHFSLIITPAPDGALEGFIRDPESNAGARVGTRTVRVNGAEVRLSRDGKPTIVGRYDAAAATLTFAFYGYAGSFVFKRELAPPERVGYHVPVSNGDGWPVASQRDVGLDATTTSALLERIQAPVTSLAAPYIQSVQIARHGKLVLDEYFNGFSIDRPHDVRSAGKSVTTLLVGRAIQDGAALQPASEIYPLFPEYVPFANDDPRKQVITLADLMTMSSGYACDDNDDDSPGNEDNMQSQTKQPDWYKYTLDLPMAFDPGTRAVYCTADINLLGGVISRVTGRWLPDYFYDRFAAPMRFGPYAMWLTPPPLNTAYMGGGDYFLPRDFLKFGQLFLDGGRWDGQPIIDPAWLQASAEPHSGLERPGDYGYGWHLYAFDVDGRSIKAVEAGGNGGQLLFIFPQLDMVAEITAANYGQYPVWQKFITDLIPNYIVRAAK
jgi:CubicO group peptidase (beta-lactamase class C family)